MMSTNSLWKVYAAFIVIGLLGTAPFVFQWEDSNQFTQRRGQNWQTVTEQAELSRQAILHDRQWPLWNPYAADGGTVLLAQPENRATSPWFLAVLLFGTTWGFRLLIALFFIMAVTGTAALLRHWKVRPMRCWIAGFLFILNPFWWRLLADGHLQWGMLGAVPWLLLWTLKSGEHRRYFPLAAMLFASTITFGQPIVPLLFVPLFTVLFAIETCRRKSLRLFVNWLAIFTMAMFLSAIKICPMWEFITDTQNSISTKNITGRIDFSDGPEIGQNIFLESGNQNLHIAKWTMNEQKILVNTQTKDRLQWNQNGAVGWRAIVISSTETGRYETATDHSSGAVSVPLQAGDREVILRYVPDSFVWGFCLSGITGVSLVIFLIAQFFPHKKTTLIN